MLEAVDFSIRVSGSQAFAQSRSLSIMLHFITGTVKFLTAGIDLIILWSGRVKRKVIEIEKKRFLCD